MTLYRQLVVIILLIFVATFAGTFFITVHNSRQYLITQLQSHAQDAATMLGLSISPIVDDRATVESMVNAVFDRGDYRLIRVENIQNKTLVKRSIPVKIQDIPSWFIRLVPLSTAKGESLIMRGWNQAGTVYVESHPGYVYQETWRNVIGTFSWFLACTLIILAVGLWLLRKVLKPLYDVERQAESICGKNFIVQPELPRTRELARVVAAMNTLSTKVKKMFLEEAEQTEKLREELFSNEVTGLGNRRYFDSQLKHLIDSPEEFGSGAVFLVALRNLHKINRELGFQIGDQVLRKTAEILSQQRVSANSLLARFSGSEFSLLIPGLQAHEADRFAEKICQAMNELESLGIDNEHAFANVGVAIYKSGQSGAELLSCADLALRCAQSHGSRAWYRNPDDIDETEAATEGAREWRRRLLDAVRFKQIDLFFQPVINRDGSIMHHEVLARLPDRQGKFIAAGLFVPIAEREGIITEIDKMTLSIWFERMKNDKQEQGHFAVNLSPSSIQNSDFLGWLFGRFKKYPELSSRLILEVSEHGVSCQVEAVRDVVQKLNDVDCRFAIDHFGRGFNSFSYLRTLNVSYLKIDGSFIRNIASHEDNQFFVKALTKTAHELEIPVIAEYVESADDRAKVIELKVDGMQGYLIARPGQAVERV